MKLLLFILRFLIPFVVLYAIGYFVPGFSALTVPWLLLLSFLIMAGHWLVEQTIRTGKNRMGHGLVNFLVALVVIFTATLGIEGGSVPIGAAIVSAAFIALLNSWVTPETDAVRGVKSK